MQTAVLVALAALAWMGQGTPTTDQGRAPRVVDFHACDVDLNVTDPDPAGLNIRMGPSSATGRLTALVPQGEWIQVHVIGQTEDWYQIDRAVAVTDGEETAERVLFEGTGWVHASKVGDVDLNAGAEILDRPGGKVILRAPLDGSAPPPYRITGCTGRYLKLEMEGRAGFTTGWCANQRTTCS
ncbi:SH3 domain-containing protein [Caulobacter mirabilis]|uniref:SH3b domain-containing protein n=1 Tax=Caulobacter mirabilis TaxID=69666 RepID=A0A2D2B2I6_9CAUL|nr:SH3 domain-containing protein [Caulobacter mirabilis]ATQ44469.1 hypothetical protein CSW64_19800 [Caulobacter mirabilis]